MTILELERENAQLKLDAAAGERDWKQIAIALGMSTETTSFDHSREMIVEHARALHTTLTSAPVMREDVWEFAKTMAAVMDSKKIERETRQQPHYMHADYPLADAIIRLRNKTDRLVYLAQSGEEFGKEVRCELTWRTAVHLANFCMIIARKVEGSQGPNYQRPAAEVI